jgi:ABC-type Fe3+-citrate transport system substrate-binding protein
MCVGHSSDSLERLFVISKDNYLDELIRSAGAENAAIVSKDEYGRASQGLVVEMTRQQAIDAKPEVVIDLLPDREPTAVERQKTEAMWRGLFAAQPSAPRRIYVLYDPYLGVPGMRIPDSLRKMGRWIYPEI